MSRNPLAAVDRKTASLLNPFIGSHSICDGLDAAASTLIEIGCLLTSADSPQPERLWPVFHAMATAMQWESEAISAARAKEKESCHV